MNGLRPSLFLPALWTVRLPWSIGRRSCVWATTAAVLCVGLSGCAWTLITAADATGSVIQAGYAIASNYSSPTFVNGHPASISTVCIEVNQMVSVGDRKSGV